MKSLLIILNWQLSLCSLCIDTEWSPLWASLACLLWFVGACWLMRYARPYGIKRLFVKMRRFLRSLWQPKFDFEEFNRGLEKGIKYYEN